MIVELLTHGSGLMTQLKTVAVVLSGPPDHFGSLQVDALALKTARLAASRIDFASEFSVRLLQPLLLHFAVTAVVGCDGAAERAGWKAFLAAVVSRLPLFADRIRTFIEKFEDTKCSAATPSATPQAASASPTLVSSLRHICSDLAGLHYSCACLPPQGRSLFSQSSNKYAQWAKLARMVGVLERVETSIGIEFDYVVKARNDFIYRPDQLLEPRWLQLLQADEVAVPAMPFQAPRAGYHDASRRDWQQPWPFNGINDQLAFGRRAPMLRYLSVAAPATARRVRASSCWPTLDSLPRALRSPERLLAIVLTHCDRLKFTLVDLQYVTTHFAGVRRRTSNPRRHPHRTGPSDRNGSFDMSPEADRLSDLVATGKARCPFCLRPQPHQPAGEHAHAHAPEVRRAASIELSRGGVRLFWHHNGREDGVRASPLMNSDDL